MAVWAGRWKVWFVVGVVGLGCAVMIAPAAPPPTTTETGKGGGATTSPVRTLLAEETNTLEREIAARMMRRGNTTAERRGRLEMEIDLRIIQRALMALTADAKFQSPEQAAAWLRAKQFREAVHGMEDALAQDGGSGTAASQREALGQLHRLSFVIGEPKAGKDLDEFCHGAALAMANVVSATPIDAAALVPMRPKSLPGGDAKDRAASVGELTEQVQKLAAISVQLRQQLLALASAASSAEKEEARALYAILSQSLELARGLQSNTAVGPEARTAIEAQLAEGIVLFSDSRTRDAGRNRIDALGQYRQTLARIGRMGLSKEQMEQLAPALAWAQANPEAGAKLMTTIQQYLDLCGQWEALSKDVSIPTTLRRPLDDLKAQFAKQRSSFIPTASHIGPVTPGDLEQVLEEMKRLYAVTEDLQAMGASIDTLNTYKVKPIGVLEKKIATAALAAAIPMASTNRNDGQKYLDSVHALAKLSRALSAHPLSDVPPVVAQGWAGGKIDIFENRWKAIVADLIGTLIGGAIDLDKGKAMRLDGALAMGEALRAAGQLEAALPKMPALARWVDWSIDPGSLQVVLSPYKEAMAGAFFGYASDNLDAVDKWNHLRGRYGPLIALILRDAAYAEQCETLPTGFAAEVNRLATPFEGAPFAIERYASYAIGVWAAEERGGDVDTADRMAIDLAKHVAHELHLQGNVDETPTRTGKKLKN